MNFEKGRWYRIRVRVEADRIQAWIDAKRVVNVVIGGKKLTTRAEVDLSMPLGIASFETRAALRNIRIRLLKEADWDGVISVECLGTDENLSASLAWLTEQIENT